jgi:hypothetical protein
MRPYTDAKCWDTLPQLILTSPNKWVPSVLDHDLDDYDKWFDAISDLPPDGPGTSLFDAYGELHPPHLIVNEHMLQPPDLEDRVIPTKGFEEGSAQEWIDLQRDIQEIWTQNSITGGTDRASTARALICGESLTSFEASLDEATRNEVNGVAGAPLCEMVDTVMTAVATTVFPHRALEIQRLWMTRGCENPTK